MKTVQTIAAVMFTAACMAQQKVVEMNRLHEINAETIGGEMMQLSTYSGNVLLIVNTAGKCGFTGQFEGLQKLYESYSEQGLVILGFPSNDFLNQEPGSNEEIESFCTVNYGVTFPMFAKVTVKGEKRHPLYAFLTDKETNPEFSGRITWNFNKFLVSREGEVIGRFGSRIKPGNKKLITAIEAALKTRSGD
jgi:glutathione peroxidase